MIDKAVFSITPEWVLYNVWTLTLFQNGEVVHEFRGKQPYTFDFSGGMITVYSLYYLGQQSEERAMRNKVIYQCPMPADFQQVEPTKKEVEDWRRKQKEEMRAHDIEWKKHQKEEREKWKAMSKKERAIDKIETRIGLLRLQQNMWKINLDEYPTHQEEIDKLEGQIKPLEKKLSELKND
jgi:hypothetical protein